MTTANLYAPIERILHQLISNTRGPANTLTMMATAEAESDPQVLHVAVAYKTIAGLLDLASYMIEVPSATDQPLGEVIARAANYCQSLQLMLVSLSEAANGRNQESQDAASLAVQIFSELGLLGG